MTAGPDSLDVRGGLQAAAQRMATAASAGRAGIDALVARGDVDQLLILSSGAGAVAAEVVRAAATAESPVPIIVHEHRQLPGFVNRRTLVVALATIDGDDELRAAATEAEHAGAPVVVIAAEGSLAELARHWNAPWFPLTGAATPDLVAFEAVAALVTVMAQTQVFATGPADLAAAIDQLGSRLAKVTADPSAVEYMARRIGRGFVLIQGGGELGAAAARWWKRAMNVMAKAPSWAGSLPPAFHDEVAGWGQHGDVTRQVFHLVMLRHEMEHPALAATFPALEDWQLEVVGGLHEVWGEGESALAQGVDLMVQGSLLAWQLAMDAEVDPGPTPAVDSMLRSLRS